MTLAYHCDRDGCDTWQRESSRIPNGFVSIVSADGGESIGDFCTLDCLTVWAAAHSEPTEAV